MELIKSLQTEIMVQRDSIWRLTTRIFNLEKEVQELKKIVPQRSKPANMKIVSGLHRAKIREIARRKSQKRNGTNRKTMSNASQGLKSASASSSTPLNVKMEQSEQQLFPNENTKSLDPESLVVLEDESQRSEPEGTSELNEGSSGIIKVAESIFTTKKTDKRAAPSRMEQDDLSVTDSSDSDSTDDHTIKKSNFKPFSMSKSERKSGRHLDDIWDLFVVTQLSKIQKQAVCKACDKVLQWAKVESLRVHLKKCGKSKHLV